jgi:recombinational DNA repair ATPase RecF
MDIDDLLLEHLAETPPGEEAESLLLAALHGQEALDLALAGQTPSRRAGKTPGDRAEPVGTYLTEIAVTGFRGVGTTATLPLVPGPGLTIVIGRNGSGKSTFAEAAEFALTGKLERLANRTAVWKDDWRNLHAGTDPTIRVRLAIEGHPEEATVECHWSAGAALDGHESFLHANGHPPQPLSTLGWETALVPYRPFLPYGELGELINAKPSEVYDKLQSILGLGRLSEIDGMLKAARKSMKDLQSASTGARTQLMALLKQTEDERARRAEALLGPKNVDLSALAELATADALSDDTAVPRLRQIAGLELPARDAIVASAEGIAKARFVVDSLTGTVVADASAIADLLTRALAHYEGHAGESCPVCGAGTLDAAWAESARARRDLLTIEARALSDAHTTVARLVDELRRALPPVPAVLEDDLGLETSALRQAWQRWEELASTQDSGPIADAAIACFDEVADALAPVRAAARAQLDARVRVWQPVATEIAAWIATEQRSQQAGTALRGLKTAIDWLSSATDEIRNLALVPIAEQSNAIWEALRQGSNVSIARMRLKGTNTSRSLDIRLAVDDADGGLAVMSQGELHSLGIALFLPRATLPESPFRFVIIDDPVQAMDPNKVHGLAQVLAEVAQTRQVIVFTHDDRLPAAVRQLHLANARIHEVLRGPQSQVTISAASNGDPAARYLSNAWAIAKDPEIDLPLRQTLVAIQARGALESVCHDIIRRREYAAGTPAHAIEDSISRAVTLWRTIALALVGDAHKRDEAQKALERLHLQAVRVVKEANSNAHGDGFGDPLEFVKDARVLVGKLAKK